MFISHENRQLLISKYGVAHPAKFEVRFTVPKGFRDSSAIVTSEFDQQIVESGNRLSLACEQTDMPGKLFSTVDQKINTVSTFLPYGTVFEDVVMTFRCSDDMFERKFFEDWQLLIQNPITKSYGYYENYISDIEIFEYDSELNRVVHGVRLIEAYPFVVSPYTLQNDAQNTYKQQSISFKYKEWKELDVVGDVGNRREENVFTFPTFDGIIRNLIPRNLFT